MQNVLYQAHSGWRYIVIIVTILALAKYAFSWITGREWNRFDQIVGTSMPIVYDIQVLVGLVLWVMMRHWTIGSPRATWEHPVTMIIALAVMHISWNRVKGADGSTARYRIGTIGFAIAGLIMALGVMRITGIV